MRPALCLIALLALFAIPAAAAGPEPAPPSVDARQARLCEVTTPEPDLQLLLEPSPRPQVQCGSCVAFPFGDCSAEPFCWLQCECECDHQFEQCSAGCGSPGCWFTCEQQAVNCYDCCSLM